MPRLIIDVDSFAADKKLKGLVDASRDLRPLLIGLGMMAIREFDKNFRAQGRPTQWAPLKPKTLHRRRKSGKGAKILRDTGRLQQSLSQGRIGNVYRLEPRSLTIGSNLVYARIHQFGGTIKRRPRSKPDGTPIRKKFAATASARMTYRARTIRIPARPYLVIPAEAISRFQRAVKKWLKESMD